MRGGFTIGGRGAACPPPRPHRRSSTAWQLSSVNRWRLLLWRRNLCDHDRNDVIESTSGGEFIEIHFVFDSAIVPLDEDRLCRHSAYCTEVFRPVRCSPLARRLDDFFDSEHLQSSDGGIEDRKSTRL